MPDLPRGLNTFTHGTVQKAVVLFGRGSTRNEVVELAGLAPKDATRVRNLWAGGLLPLNERGKLVPDPRVAKVGRRIALRYLDERRENWLDPHDAPPPPA